MHATSRLLAILAASFLLGGCFKKDDEAKPAATTPVSQTGGSTAPAPAPNRKPTISGSPPTTLRAGEAYDFQPSASDPDGDALTFAVSNKPAWASFETATGRLSGTPQAGDVGSFANVVISVSDGKDAASLPSWTITVNQVAMGTATLSWSPPTQNTDGSTLTDLAGYRIYYGRSATTLDQSVTIGNAGLTRYVIENLSPATWYFAMSSYNARGVESERSTVASKTVS